MDIINVINFFLEIESNFCVRRRLVFFSQLSFCNIQISFSSSLTIIVRNCLKRRAWAQFIDNGLILAVKEKILMHYCFVVVKTLAEEEHNINVIMSRTRGF